MAETEARQWTIVLILTALLLSIIVLSQILTTYITAYRAAPREITAFVEAADFSVAENESYDRDVAKVQHLEDKLRLVRLLRQIQNGGDDLHEKINSMLLSDGDDTTTLRAAARLLWASKRRDLEERVRRLDLVRMRFLVVYMGVVAERASATAERQAAVTRTMPRDPEKAAAAPFTPPMSPMNAGLTRALTEVTEEIRQKPLRRLTTTVGHREDTIPGHKKGWAGVVQELQKSPKMHKRHASIERSIDQKVA